MPNARHHATIVTLPKARPRPHAVWEASIWVQSLDDEVMPASLPIDWRLFEDNDGSLMIVPLGDEPGFAIMPAPEGGFDVLVCEPDDMDELGPFGTFRDALAGIGVWLRLPKHTI